MKRYLLCILLIIGLFGTTLLGCGMLEKSLSIQQRVSYIVKEDIYEVETRIWYGRTTRQSYIFDTIIDKSTSKVHIDHVEYESQAQMIWARARVIILQKRIDSVRPLTDIL